MARVELLKSLINLGALLTELEPPTEAALVALRRRAHELTVAARQSDPANVNLLTLAMGVEGELAAAHRQRGRLTSGVVRIFSAENAGVAAAGAANTASDRATATRATATTLDRLSVAICTALVL